MMLKKIKAIFTAISIMIAGMRGGQKNKAVRRFGIPLLALFASWTKGFSFKDCAFLLLIPMLCMGYGENSQLMKLIGNETMVRIVYASLLSLPFLFYGLRRFVIAILALIIAFQIRAGSLGNISWFGDILIEDIARYGTLGILITYNIFTD